MSDLIGGDPDQVFAYHTQQQVNILDKSLGIVNTMLSLGVVFYLGYDLYFNEGYYQYEAARGMVVTHNSGDAYVASKGKPGHRYFSSDEIGIPGLENGNRFVATKVTVHNQKRGVCEDLSKKCDTDDDCSVEVGGKCTDNGFCKEPTWCSQDVDATKGLGAEIYDIPSSDHLIWVKSAIQYLQLEPDRLVASDMTTPIRYPEENFNLFTVEDILDLCYPKVHFQEISQLGAALEVQFIYDCVVNSKLEGCKPKVTARRLDNLFVDREFQDIGFGFKKVYFNDGLERELHEVRGVRIYFRAVGTGREASPVALMMRVSTGLALLGVATILTDVIMLRFMAYKDKYFARKYIESEDFSCLEEFEAEENAKKKAAHAARKERKEARGGGDDEGWMTKVGLALHVTSEGPEDEASLSEDEAEAEWRHQVDEEE